MTNWKEVTALEYPKGNIAAYAYEHKLVPLQVLSSDTTFNDASWIHISVSRPDRLPSWEEIKKVADEFIGDRIVIHVIPKKKDYVNVHNFCIHLWSPNDNDTEAILPNLQNITWESGRKNDIR